MKLTDRDREIFHVIQHQPESAIADLCKLLPFREHTIRRSISLLKQKGWMRRDFIFDAGRLGLHIYNLAVTLSCSSAQRNLFVKTVCANPFVCWFAEMGATYDYGFTLLARSDAELFAFMEKIAETAGDIIDHKAIVVEVGEGFFGSKFLAPWSTYKVPPIIYDTCTYEEPASLDVLDRKILDELPKSNYDNLTTLARQLGIAVTTLQYRLDKLRANAVIAGQVYSLNLPAVGAEELFVHISMKSVTSNLRREVFDYCIEHPNIHTCVQTVGPWDFKFIIQGWSKNELRDTVDAVRLRFAHVITKCDVISSFKAIKYLSNVL
jgi:DNA-binding Lrp family transcriptional regulator